MRRALLALLFLTPGIALAASSDPLTEIDACAARLDDKLDVGFERIAARCPTLAATLKGSSYGAWLPHDWDGRGNQLSPAGLQDLKLLLLRERRRAPVARELSVAAVPSILAGIAAADQPRTPWERFKAWLHRLLSVPPQHAQQNWLRRLIGLLRAPESVWRLISWVALGVVVALAATVVVNELRAAGVLRRRTRTVRAAPLLYSAQTLTPSDIEQAEPAQQPRLLLGLIAARLTAQARLPQSRALTVRELTSVAELADPLDRARLADLAAACEQLRYSEHEPAPSVLRRALAEGAALLASLEAAAAPQPQGA
jgi:hypothetical protein